MTTEISQQRAGYERPCVYRGLPPHAVLGPKATAVHTRKSCPHCTYVKVGEQPNKKMSVVVVLVIVGGYNQVP